MTRVTHLMGLALGLIVASSLTAACARSGVPNQPAGPGQWPDGRTFLSTSVTEGGKERPLVAGTQIALTFGDNGRLGAQAGCNQIGGTGRIDGDLLIVGALSTTEMACDPARMDQDTWLASFLSAAPTFDLSGDELTLTGGAVQIMLTDRRVLDPDRPLAGPRWVVDTIITGEVASSVPSGLAAYVVFDGRGGVTGSTGCQPLRGTATVSGDHVTIVLAETATCTGEAASLHAAVLATLRGDVGYRIEGPRLTLSGPGGAGLGLRAQP